MGKNTLTIEATGVASKLDAMENLFRAYGIRQLTRTGMVAMGRGHDAWLRPIGTWRPSATTLATPAAPAAACIRQ